MTKPQILSCLEMHGEDCTAFIKNMFSQDIADLESGHARFAAFSNPKGRVIANGFFIKHEDRFFFACDAGIAAPLAQKLTLYKLRSKLDITLAANYATCLAGKEETLTETLTEGHLDAPLDTLKIVISRNKQLASDYRPLAVANGLAIVNEEQAEKHVAQMLNMDLLSGINFKKGCYPGQEIIARMHYLGKLKQRTVKLCGPDGLLPGTAVYAGDKKNTGDILFGDDKGHYLAVLRLEHLQNAPTLNSENGDKLTLDIESLPYSLPDSL